MTEKLLPCPFCGGEASPEGYARYTKNHEAWWADGSQVLESFHVNCVKCAISNIGMIGHQSRAKAITAWNTRTADPSVAVLREALEKIANDPYTFGQRVQRLKRIAAAALSSTNPTLSNGEPA